MEAGTRSGRLVGVLAVVVVAGVAGLSLASSVIGGGENGDQELPPTTGPDATTQASATTTGPELGSLAALPLPASGSFEGRITYVDGDCRLAATDLSTLRTSIVATDLPQCSTILSPSGGFGLVSRGAGVGAEVYAIGPDGTSVVGTGPPLGPAGYGPPAVSDRGEVAVCSTDPLTNEATVTRQDPRTGQEDRVLGCRPAFAGAELMVASRGERAAVRDGAGDVVVPRSALPRPSRGDLVLASSSDGALLGVLSRTEDLDKVDLSLFTADGTPRGTWQDVHSGADLRTLRVAATGTAAAMDVNGVWRLVELQDGGSVDALESIGGARIGDVDFSPDGAHAAVLVDGAILLVDAGTLGPIAALRVDARSVRWLP